jgi:2-polyprenyl-3-methyl-5-hydroxy-6-metoxy-1,4-benzoquinol methylase
MPNALLRQVVRAALSAATRQAPPRALRTLLEVDRDLTGLIDETALAYDGGVHVKHRLTGYDDFFVGRVKAGERVLDLGCGYGAVAHALVTRAGAHVVGIDLSADNITLARARYRHPDLVFVHGDARVALPADPVNVVVLSNVLEHLDDRVTFLRDVQAKVGPERWLVRVPAIDRDWRVPLRRELGLFAFSDPTHVTEYTREAFEAEMRAAGFRIRHLQVNWGELWAEVAADA